MKLSTDVINTTADILECMLIKDLQWAKLQDNHLWQLKDYIYKVGH